MADKNIVKTKKADRRRKRVRSKVIGTSQLPRLTVAKTLNNLYIQIIDDTSMKTLASVSSASKELKSGKKAKENKTVVAKKVGESIGKIALEKGIERVVFDRNKNLYHGRIKAAAEGAREAGLKF